MISGCCCCCCCGWHKSEICDCLGVIDLLWVLDVLPPMTVVIFSFISPSQHLLSSMGFFRNENGGSSSKSRFLRLGSFNGSWPFSSLEGVVAPVPNEFVRRLWPSNVPHKICEGVITISDFLLVPTLLVGAGEWWDGDVTIVLDDRVLVSNIVVCIFEEALSFRKFK